MKNARELQDRDRRLEEQSVAALLSADLHRKFIMLVLLLLEPAAVQVEQLATMDRSTRVFEAALPKLGALGHQGAANLLAAFDGIAQLASDARVVRQQDNVEDLTTQMRAVALNIGCVVNTLWGRYKLDRPEPLEKAKISLEAAWLEKLKNLGL